MTSSTGTQRGVASQSVAFDRFAGVSGIVTGVSSLLYAAFFLLTKGQLYTYLPPFFLALGGFLALPLALAVYSRVRDADPRFALYALLLSTVGNLAAAVHGVYGLALVLPKAQGGSDTLVFEPDPRGFLSFGVTGVSVLIFAWLILRSGAFPRVMGYTVGYTGYVLGIALVALFLGTLLVDNAASNFILVPGGIASVIGTPVWSIGLGLRLLARGAA
jgi:hypothetical protein